MSNFDRQTHNNKSLDVQATFGPVPLRMESQKDLVSPFDAAAKLMRSLVAPHFAQSRVCRLSTPENVRA